jgi:MYXO-CTERM domain-containing protein
MKKLLLAAAVLLGVFAPARRADAFCGFYVGGAGTEMFNHATQVVMMRAGTKTVLSMQNNYEGPPSDFALVVPVPVVLHEGDVKTLAKDVFAKVDVMGSPRLVEYWEQDPCAPPQPEYDYRAMAGGAMDDASASNDPEKDYGVKVEARFEVGEYQIVILSATESTGLDRYLRDQKYAIPEGAEPLLRPYVEGGSKFFVAKVNPKKVHFEHGMAMLSPLRFDYDSEEFSLPIRLGLANSAGTQDLIVNILSPTRYQVANYDNVTIPTNLEVKDDVRKEFGAFYAALFDRTMELHPRAVVTEYAWDATSCDPCPGPTIDYTDLLTLGDDVIGQGGYTLTRLHARYGKDDMKEDLVFQEATAIVGGRESVVDEQTGKLEEGATPSDYNNFQGRYIIRHPWTGPVACDDPQRGIWGGPPDGAEIATEVATDLAFAPRGEVQLPMLVAQDVPEIDVKEGVAFVRPATASKAHGCAGCAAGGGGGGALAGLAALLVIRKRRKS